jgi:hypothetical protein
MSGVTVLGSRVFRYAVRASGEAEPNEKAASSSR